MMRRALRLLGLLGAILGPLVVFWAANHALAPRRALDPKAIAFDKQLRAHPPEVVVLGSSWARTDIDPARLATRLKTKPAKVSVLSVGLTTAPVWYAMLRERVYGNDCKPRLIVLPVSLGGALVVRPSAIRMAELYQQMPVPDEVVSRRTLGDPTEVRIQWLLSHRGDLRDPLLNAFRDLLPRRVLGQDADAVAAAGLRVFGKEHERADARALPGVELETRAEGGSFGWLSATDPAESYLADMVRLAKENGAEVVVALPPTIGEASAGQAVPPELEQATVRWAKDNGVHWIDLRQLPWDESYFIDGDHLRKNAARLFTDLVADQLLGEHLAADAADQARSVERLAATVRRQGTPPDPGPVRAKPGKDPCDLSIAAPDYGFLSQLGTENIFPRLRSPLRVREGKQLLQPTAIRGTCTGTAVHRARIAVSRLQANGPPLKLVWAEDIPDGEGDEATWWVYPGTALVWTFPEAWTPEEGPATVILRAGALGPGAGVPVLRIGDEKAPLQKSGNFSTASLPAPTRGPWSLVVASPKRGPFLFVDSLTLRAGSRTATVVASRYPHRLDLFDPAGWRVDTAPPELEKMPIRTWGDKSWFQVPWNSFSYCSPFRVSYAGSLLMEAELGPHDGAKGTWHGENRLRFEALPGTDPKVGYRAVYDPDRRCARLSPDSAEQVWLYPGETLKIEVSPERRAAFESPLVRLVLKPTPAFEASDAAVLKINAHLGEQLLLVHEVRGGALELPIDLVLPSPLDPAAEGLLSVTLSSSPDLPPLLLLGSGEDH